jgi:hypothetical protein
MINLFKVEKLDLYLVSLSRILDAKIRICFFLATSQLGDGGLPQLSPFSSQHVLAWTCETLAPFWYPVSQRTAATCFTLRFQQAPGKTNHFIHHKSGQGNCANLVHIKQGCLLFLPCVYTTVDCRQAPWVKPTPTSTHNQCRIEYDIVCSILLQVSVFLIATLP